MEEQGGDHEGTQQNMMEQREKGLKHYEIDERYVMTAIVFYEKL